MFDASKYLGSNDVIWLQNLEDEYWGPAENEDSHHHSQHWDNLNIEVLMWIDYEIFIFVPFALVLDSYFLYLCYLISVEVVQF